MKKFIGVKIIEAKPMMAAEAGKLLNRPIDTSNADAEGNGYLVRYSDGYISWSPKAQFEEAYRQTDGMTFGLALEAVKKGKGMRLPQWSPEVVIRAQYPDEHSKMTAPYLYVESRFGRVPWKETMIELFSENWVVVD
jgi:hypothetical protein